MGGNLGREFMIGILVSMLSCSDIWKCTVGAGSCVYSIKREKPVVRRWSKAITLPWVSFIGERKFLKSSEMQISHLIEIYPLFFPVTYFVSWEDGRDDSREEKLWKPSSAHIYYLKREAVNWRLRIFMVGTWKILLFLYSARHRHLYTHVER